MKRKLNHTIKSLALALLFLSGCRDPFEPEVTDQDISLLVVEGFIETGGEGSEIILSRTNPIRSNQNFLPESGASVFLKSENGEEWVFQEAQAGVYTVSASFDQGLKYQLGINLRNGQQYLSEPMTPIVTPEIEELGYLRDEAGVEIFVSTKGNEEAQYFLWDYEEDWIFRPGVRSQFFFNPATKDVEFRKADQKIDLCWKSNLFPKIILQNASRFQDNTILQRELVRIPLESEKLMQRYSINVRQRAINQETYDFWEILRKNSDDIGGIFSPLPSLIRGNMKSLDPNGNNVIGMVSMGKSTSKRIYIDVEDVAPWPYFIQEYEFCKLDQDTVLVADYEREFASGSRLPVIPVVVVTTTIGFRAATRQCTDCTLRGTNIKPDFWED
ncbi:DUF4249 domain-containing protein [Cognataquiflexum aquatile]|uniref:DUF4249 domain-containing protein n=1 Tax=Cognataquiflexum aquatile TaxID=2249427 RepID=UPI000DEA9A84|nr:DUF4249 domain-containing protein [Cognataquiflexum aquatile]